jgi:hypothetical protein
MKIALKRFGIDPASLRPADPWKDAILKKFGL